MITKQRRGFTLALILAVGSSAQAADETAVVRRATKLLEEISSNPESGIPPRFLQEAKAIVIVPHIVENQLGVGRRKGRGVFLLRNEKGEWGNPDPVTISGLSLGVKAGRMVTDMVLIYRTKKAVDRRTKDPFTLSLALGATVSLHFAAQFSGPDPDSATKKDVLIYEQKRGALVGAMIGGEVESYPSRTPLESKAPPAADQTATSTDTKATVKVTKRDAPVPNAKAKLFGDPPEVARLKTVLTTLTSPPPAQIAETSRKDPNVRPASGAKTR